MASIDINCDMGESYGAFVIGQDAALMDYVSSVNIACGFHGGDPTVMKKTVGEAVRRGLAIGAHPGYPDLQGFGRREMKFLPEEIYDIVLYQVGALKAFVEAAGTTLYHVKPHGALYNVAAKDLTIANSIAQAVADVDKNLRFTGLSGSELIRAGEKVGLKTISEVFADRTYQDDGTLTPRTQPNALIENESEAARQVLDMAVNKTVRTQSGKQITIMPDSVCIHGDGRNALAYAKAIVHQLNSNHVSIARP